MTIFDDFFTRAIVGGVGIALIAGPLGCFVVWQRLAYLGDAMAHSALLGIALTLAFNAAFAAFQINILVGVFTLCVVIAFFVARVDENATISGDSLLGILSHSTLAIGLVLVALMDWIRVDILHYLFGSILSISKGEILTIYMVGILYLVVFVRKWKDLIALTVSEQIAAAEKMKPLQTRYLLLIMLAGVIAFAMKIVGVVLTVSLLIIPAAAARHFSKTPEQMAVIAAVFGAFAVISGLTFSLNLDTQPGPSIVICALLIFICGILKNMLRTKVGEFRDS